MPSVNVYRRNLRKIKFSIKASKHAISNGVCLLIWNIFPYIGNDGVLFWQSLWHTLSSQPSTDSILNPGGKSAALDISGCSGCPLECRNRPWGCPASPGHQTHPWRWGWTRDGIGRHNKGWHALLALTMPGYFSVVVPSLWSPFYPESTENLGL